MYFARTRSENKEIINSYCNERYTNYYIETGTGFFLGESSLDSYNNSK